MKIRTALLCLVALCLLAPAARPHCEVPCGIYDDEMRVKQIREDITTIEKAMKNIAELSKVKEPDYNQIVRWVTTKEEHAERIQQTAMQYFMAQRVKPVKETDEEAFVKYVRQLTLLHEMVVYAMKCKQGVDLENASKLRGVVDDFEKEYFAGKKDGDHSH